VAQEGRHHPHEALPIEGAGRRFDLDYRYGRLMIPPLEIGSQPAWLEDTGNHHESAGNSKFARVGIEATLEVQVDESRGPSPVPVGLNLAILQFAASRPQRPRTNGRPTGRFRFLRRPSVAPPTHARASSVNAFR
jgi:hypothetical protein